MQTRHGVVAWGASCLGAWLGLAGCGDDTGGSSAGATDSSTTAGSDSQATTQATATTTGASAGSTGGGMSDSNDADTTPPTTTSPTTTDPTATTGGTTTATATTGDTEATTAVSASTGEGTSGGSTGGMGGCGVSDDCPDGQVCVAGECVPFQGTCDEHADCHGDTYCCEGGCLPPGEQPGVCIDFGTGPEGGAHEDCDGLVPVGLFQPSVQCEWTAPPPNDPFPNHKSVLATPLAAPLPHVGQQTTELVFVTYNFTDGGAQSGYGSDPNYYGVIRVVNPRTCAQLESIHDPANKMIAATPPAIADLDADGVPEIVTHRASTGVIAFKWNDAQQKYATWWVAMNTGVVNATRWDGPSVHDLDNDNFPEVISASAVFDGLTGERLNPGQLLPGAGPGVVPVLGDLDGDGAIEIIAGSVWRWNIGTNKWEMAYTGAPNNRHYGFADFGTAGPNPADFDPTKLDGVAEIVSVGGNLVRLHTLSGQLLLSGPIGSGGPPTIGDFDKDGFPEIAAAGGTAYVVYDLDCKNGGPGCAAVNIRWTRPSQDASSATTGSSIFDFEFDQPPSGRLERGFRGGSLVSPGFLLVRVARAGPRAAREGVLSAPRWRATLSMA
jgi:hypothetical protein